MAAVTAEAKAVEVRVELTEAEETVVATGLAARAGDSVVTKVAAMVEETAAGTEVKARVAEMVVAVKAEGTPKVATVAGMGEMARLRRDDAAR